MLIESSARHRARGRRGLALASAAALSLTTLGLGVGGLFTASAADAAPVSPLAGNHGFTVLTQGDLTISGGAAAETEGAIAVGGSVTQTGGKYSIIPGGTGEFTTEKLPVVDGARTRLLVNGQVSLPGDGERIHVDADRSPVNVTIGTGNYATTADGRITPAGQSGYVKSGATSTPGAFATKPNAFASVFGTSTFTDYQALSLRLTQLAGDGVHVVTSQVGPINASLDASSVGLALAAGQVNVWNVTSAELASLQSHSDLRFTAASPDATTPLIINLPSASAFTNPRFASGATTGLAPYVLWNLYSATPFSFTLSGSRLFDGAILAPNAAFTFDKATPMEGQFVFASADLKGAAEIHHVAFVPQIPATSTSAPVTANATAAHATCTAPTNALDVASTTGVHYTWTSGGTGRFTALHLSGGELAPGTVYAFTAASDPGFTLTGTTSFSFTFAGPPTDCGSTDPVTATPVVRSHQGTCAAPDSTLDVEAVQGIRFTWTHGREGEFTELHLRGDELTPGTTYSFSAKAEPSYRLGGDTADFTYAFTAVPTGCGGTTTVAKDASGGWDVQDPCLVDSSYTVRAASHAAYTVSVNGGPAATVMPGSHPAELGKTYTLVLVPDAGHALAAGATSVFVHTFQVADGCQLETHPLVHGTVSHTAEQCAATTTNSFTVEAAEHVTYTSTRNGVTVPIAPGTYRDVQVGDEYRIDAHADSSEYGLEADSPSTWSFTFTKAVNCGQLLTLAYTGTQPFGPLLVAGAAISGGLLLLAAGLVISASRRRRV